MARFSLMTNRTIWDDEHSDAPVGVLPGNVFRYVLATSGVHQLVLLALTVTVFLLEIVPLELQRRVVNDLVKKPFLSLGDHSLRHLRQYRPRPGPDQARAQRLPRLGRRARLTRPAPADPLGRRGSACFVTRS